MVLAVLDRDRRHRAAERQAAAAEQETTAVLYADNISQSLPRLYDSSTPVNTFTDKFIAVHNLHSSSVNTNTAFVVLATRRSSLGDRASAVAGMDHVHGTVHLSLSPTARHLSPSRNISKTYLFRAGI